MKKIILFTIFFTISLSILGQQKDFYLRLSDAAIELTKDRVIYDPAYRSIPYPNGDVAPNRGVCTDVIVRAYRKLGIDLQQKVHEDMNVNFKIYPQRWGLKRPDTNIDHRRVPNLNIFFSRHGEKLSVTNKPEDYKPGDIVIWVLDNGLDHIGIVVDKKSRDGKRYLIVHNIGGGQVAEDCLFKWKLTGHFRYK
jgi:uncharacterized protein YijF (DUF1287 family)